MRSQNRGIDELGRLDHRGIESRGVAGRSLAPAYINSEVTAFEDYAGFQQ